jgi:hypothetical protein
LKTHYLNGNRLGISNHDNTTTTNQSLDARTFKSMICNRSIEGVNKNITMNSICDRVDIGYSVYDMNPDTGELEVYILFHHLCSRKTDQLLKNGFTPYHLWPRVRFPYKTFVKEL